ncbi:MAG: GNAT family N-acetyltransferase, partial [Clostridia bacterium]|nr:GNAT family N-acetyltransferase [Clostridia bacterium]
AVLTQQIFSSPKAFLAGHIGICPREKMQESEKSARQNQLGSTPVRLSEWGNAILAERKHLDMLAIGAYDGDALVGMAGCSADCDTMWQIGIDVLPAYRKQGIASALTSRLAIEILNRGKVPFYCAAWSNIKSVRNAIKSGFRLAWVEVTAKPCETVDRMNQK